jgi:hypothetical protein
LEINSKPNSNLIQNSTICFDSWGKRKRRPRGTKPLNQLEEIGSDLAGNGGARPARVRAPAARRREVEDDLTGGPHLSASGRERARARLGPAGPSAGEREKRGEMGRNRPKDQEGGDFELFKQKTIYEMLFQLLKILPLLK